MPTRSGIGVTGIADETEMVVMDEDVIHHHRLTNKKTGVLRERATRMYQLDPVQAETKAPQMAHHPLCLLPLSRLRRLIACLNRPPLSFHL